MAKLQVMRFFPVTNHEDFVYTFDEMLKVTIYKEIFQVNKKDCLSYWNLNHIGYILIKQFQMN